MGRMWATAAAVTCGLRRACAVRACVRGFHRMGSGNSTFHRTVPDFHHEPWLACSCSQAPLNHTTDEEHQCSEQHCMLGLKAPSPTSLARLRARPGRATLAMGLFGFGSKPSCVKAPATAPAGQKLATFAGEGWLGQVHP